jgi:hypothetical protein
MAEAENYTTEEQPSPDAESVAVIVPLFPRLPGLRESLASLGAQTRPPDLVVLLDDGTSPEAESLHGEIPDLHVEVVQVEPGTLPAAVNAVMEYLVNFDYVTFLQAGDAFAPERIARCLDALAGPGERRPPSLVVTGLVPVDGRGQPLAPDDPRTRHLATLWAPGAAGVGLPEWLGAGHFTGPVSNIFARRTLFDAHLLPEELPAFHQATVLLAALQGQMTVIHDPLLFHHPSAFEREPTTRMMTENLQVQLAVLAALSEKLAVSPETRRAAAAYHRAAWNSRTAVREDLFQQLVLRLASTAAAEEGPEVLAEILRSREAQKTPAHWEALLEGSDPLDLAGYADALRRTREKLEEAQEEIARLQPVAAAAQASGWVRFGAWLGNRGARRMMELEEDEEEEPAADTPPAPPPVMPPEPADKIA